MSVTHRRLYLLLALAVMLNVALWGQLCNLRARWLNVPPAPSVAGASAFALGDPVFSYRTIGLMLQNLGDNGGMTTALRDYNYDNLTDWFYLSDKLDPHSNFVPLLAAYYFGGVDAPEKLGGLAQYLHDIGLSPEKEKWRWLAQAIYIERYKIKNLDKAYDWAVEMASIDNPDMPAWSRQMPAFVKMAQGDKQAAYDIMLEIMKSGNGKIDAIELNFMKDYICTKILEPDKAKENPLCQDNQDKK